MTENKNILVILAAGIGSRYGSTVPKQYTMLNGQQVIDISITEMKKSKADQIVVVLNDDPQLLENIHQVYQVDTIIGGKDRAHSFQNALNYIYKTYPQAVNVIFHEAARPLVYANVINEYFKLLDTYDYVETCSKIVDSLGSYTVKAPVREDYYLIQAPEAYRIEVLKKYFDCESKVYFAANQFPDSCKGYRSFGIQHNFKLTTPEDKLIIEALLKNKQ